MEGKLRAICVFLSRLSVSQSQSRETHSEDIKLGPASNALGPEDNCARPAAAGYRAVEGNVAGPGNRLMDGAESETPEEVLQTRWCMVTWITPRASCSAHPSQIDDTSRR